MDQSEIKNTVHENHPEIIISVIDDIQHAGFASISHWSIMITNAGVYFFDMGAHYHPLGAKNMLENYKVLDADRKPEMIRRFKAVAQETYFIDKGNIAAISAKKGWFKNSISFVSGGKNVHFGLDNYELRKFVGAIDILRSYTRSAHAAKTQTP